MSKILTALVLVILVFVATVFGAHYYVGQSSAEVPVGSTSANAQTARQQGSSQNSGGHSSAASPKGGSRGRGRRSSLVVASTVTEGTINDRLTAVGDVEALASVDVLPLDGGILEEVLVESGQAVEAGDVLARLDSEAEEIARNRAGSAVEEARVKVIRLQKLLKTRTSTQVQVDEAQSVLNSARLALQDAELTLRRRTINASIAGKVGIVNVSVGSFVNTQTSLVTIDNRESLVLDFWVPERFASAIKVGQPVDATSYAFPGKEFAGIVSAVGSRVERDSRTFLTRATIDNDGDELRPGMSFSVNLQFSGDTYPAVDPLSVQWDSEGSFVWKLYEDKVRRTGIRIVQRNADKVLVEGDLSSGDRIVSEGVLALREGATVKVTGDEPSEKDGRKSGGGKERSASGG